MFREGLTYQDVCLVPQYNNVASRTEPSLQTWMTKQTQVQIPIIPSNMDTVISPAMARILIENGTYPIFHRFLPASEILAIVQEFPQKCYISCGLQQMEHAINMIDAGARGVCIDIAHGHAEPMIQFIRMLKASRPNAEVIAGNVCTAMAYCDLVSAGADAVKVGIGPGAACTTRIQTGFGVPQFTAVYECAQMAKKLRVPIIADGGIQHPRDMVIALAAGASTVMCGSLFAKTEESPGILETESDGTLWKLYRGQASKEFQLDFYGKMRPKTVEEGIAFRVKITDTTQSVIDRFCGGLRSGLTYGGARDIKELQRKAEFIKVTSAYSHESFPRPEKS